jgi:hypothetical protein
MMKRGFHFRMLKPNSSQSNGCTHIHQTSWKSLNRRCLPARKVMATVFWDKKFMQQETTIVSQVHCETLKENAFRSRVIQNKRSGMLISSVALLHDNACPHRAARTWALMEHFNWELFYHPPYSPDLTLSDYHLFTYPKNWFWSQRFNNYKELMQGVKTWLGSQTANFFDTGIQKLIPQYKCLNSSGDYVK